MTNLGLLREINKICNPSVWSLTDWGEMIEMFISDDCRCCLECNTPVSDKICKHSEWVDICDDPKRAP